MDTLRAAATARLNAVRRARRAYCHALHLNPAAGTTWGDLASALQQEGAALQQLQQQRQQQAAGSLSTTTPAAAPPAAALQLSSTAEGLAKGGLLLQPDSDWLWALLGCVSADLGTAEYAFSRCLQLAPKNALAWVLLGRLYARHGAGGRHAAAAAPLCCAVVVVLYCYFWEMPCLCPVSYTVRCLLVSTVSYTTPGPWFLILSLHDFRNRADTACLALPRCPAR